MFGNMPRINRQKNVLRCCPVLRRQQNARPHGPQRHTNSEELQKDEHLVRLLSKVAATCYIGLATLTLAALTGWFSATDPLARPVALQLSLWLGISTVFASILYAFVQFLFSAKGPYFQHIRRAGAIIVAYMAWGTITTGLSMWSSLASVTGQLFAPDLDPSGYAEAARRATKAAGAPFTLLMPWTAEHARSPDNTFLSYWNGDRQVCRGVNIWQREQFDGEIVSGQPLPLGGTSMLVASEGDQEIVEVAIFGLKIDDTDEARRRVASHISAVVDKATWNRAPHVTCTKPAFANGKWMCFAGDGKNGREDLAYSLLQRGAAFADNQALDGTPVRLDFLRAQAHGQANGCGIWAR